MGHRVPQKVRVQLDPGDGAILFAQGPDASIRKRTTFPDKHRRRLYRRPGVEICLNSTPGLERQWHRPLLVALGESENHAAATLAQKKITKLKLSEVADTTAREEEKMKYGVGSNIITKLDLS